MKIDNFCIDPPWPNRKGGKRSVRPNQTRSLNYQTLSVPEIFEILDTEIFPLAKTTHNVFLWCIDKMLFDADKEMLSRGYKRHLRVVWDKMNGVAPSFTLRFTHEYLIWYYRPKLKPIDKLQRGRFTTVIRSKGREHSRKPDEAYTLIRKLYPKSVCMDVFSREPRKGWQQWGDELDYFSL